MGDFKRFGNKPTRLIYLELTAFCARERWHLGLGIGDDPDTSKPLRWPDLGRIKKQNAHIK